jgi:hypothetical protein
MPLNPADEFLKHAAECKRMAKYAHDSDDKAAWTRMAERWQRCAEWFESETAAVNPHPSMQHRPRPFRWANHLD